MGILLPFTTRGYLMCSKIWGP